MSEILDPVRIESLQRSLCSKKSTPRALEFLSRLGFSDSAQAFRNFVSLSKDPSTQERFFHFLNPLLTSLKNSSNPDLALNHLGRFTDSTGRSELYDSLRKSPRILELLICLFGKSTALSQTLIRHPEYWPWLLDPKILEKAWDLRQLQKDISPILENLQSLPLRWNALRRFRHRHILRIGLKDFVSVASLEELTLELSSLADTCLKWAYRLSLEELLEKFGGPRCEHNKRKRAGLAVIGMGKLGGCELNYSSDIDVMFVYSEEGETKGGTLGTLQNHEFFTRLAHRILEILSARMQEGYLYRVDTRLRPEGPTGPLVRSLEGYENYYASWGQTWERQALIKARCVAGDPEVGREFLKRVTPFIYRKYHDEKAIQEMRAVKLRIDQEAELRGEENRNVKLGLGGIREIEFGIQILQLLYGGKLECLKERNSLSAIERLVEENLLEKETGIHLKEAYHFLRKVEHYLQLEEERQTHVLPEDPEKLNHLSRSLRYTSAKSFLSDYKSHTLFVQKFYRELFSGLLSAKENSAVHTLSCLLNTGQPSEEEKGFLRSLGFEEMETAAQHLLGLAQGGETMPHLISQDFKKMLPFLLISLQKTLDPNRALVGLERFLAAYKARNVLFEMLGTHPKILDLLMLLFGTSPFLTEILVKDPNLLDVISEGMVERTNFDEGRLARVLRKGESFQEKFSSLRNFQNVEMLRLGLRDILKLSPLLEILSQISLLVERILKGGLEIARKAFQKAQGKRCVPFVIIGLGKLGGQELSFSSDLDVMFVSEGDEDQMKEANDFGAFLMELFSDVQQGTPLYKMDPRLRPDGTKGPLVQSIETLRKYYGSSNTIWERMALTRARFVAGNEKWGRRVMKILHHFVFQVFPSKDQVLELKNLREEIFQDRCGNLTEGFELKSGRGGILDIEFLVQFLQLKHGKKHPRLKEVHTLKLIQKLLHAGILPQKESALLNEAYLFYREVESALRLLKDRPTDFIPRDMKLVMRIQKKMGLALEPEHLFEKIENLGKKVRELYEKYLKA
ncbi:MAG: bifunctional [glutamate--ammonia ligase]-adenylyl-L-tyrosine phosphorylase/[glutamate--ammonia-ligase] adenylyltransferase [Chlamydiae bacterium]|nr:bifunctional [glutamate--ammonia ligase]-adenylyl-L-tyrosine phosphorylase/[glutamate--ammonia-ligase] adenylyltransferase [Chlamydiota bacterium]MBI3266323.1 bifunctional [glutamate--ammonia ligase]-adenylyl-L-tyrosine phosphorylase/[glutamate--ammonia-ligase] adenylyltransferase [Chlamydiota bacterium]